MCWRLCLHVECSKTHLQASLSAKFSRGWYPRTSLKRGKEAEGGWRERRKERRRRLRRGCRGRGCTPLLIVNVTTTSVHDLQRNNRRKRQTWPSQHAAMSAHVADKHDSAARIASALRLQLSVTAEFECNIVRLLNVYTIDIIFYGSSKMVFCALW